MIGMQSSPYHGNLAEAQMKARKSQMTSSLASLKTLISHNGPQTTLNVSHTPLNSSISTFKFPPLTNNRKSIPSSLLGLSDPLESPHDNVSTLDISNSLSAPKKFNDTAHGTKNFFTFGSPTVPIERVNSDQSWTSLLQQKRQIDTSSVLKKNKAMSISFHAGSQRDELNNSSSNMFNEKSLITDQLGALKTSTDSKRFNKTLEVASHLRAMSVSPELQVKTESEGDDATTTPSPPFMHFKKRSRFESSEDPDNIVKDRKLSSCSVDYMKPETPQLINRNIEALRRPELPRTNSAMSMDSNRSTTRNPNGVHRPQFYCHIRNFVKEEKEGPKGRVGSTLVTFRNRVYLFGGKREGKRLGLAIYNPLKEKWKFPTVTGETEGIEREGHSADVLRNFIIVFGGERLQEVSNKPIHSVCTDDLLIYYPHLKQWNKIRASSTNHGLSIEPRKHHASCVYNRLLLIYGGVLESGKLANDFWAFDAEKCKWKKIPTGSKDVSTQGIAYHRMVPVFQDTMDANYESRAKKIPEGFYVFGGKDETGEAISTLKLLSYDQKTSGLAWCIPSTRGTPPTARYMHTMTYHREAEMLIVYGGKTGGFLQKGKSNGVETNIDDMYVLLLERMTWVKPIVHGAQRLRSKFGHCACIAVNKLLIFGGTTDDHFTGFGLDQIELRETEVLKMSAEINSDKIKTTGRAGRAIQFLMTIQRLRGGANQEKQEKDIGRSKSGSVSRFGTQTRSLFSNAAEDKKRTPKIANKLKDSVFS